MTWVAFWALLSHWRRKPVQLVTLVLGLALATALWSGVQAINAEARASYAQAAASLGGQGLTRLVRRDETPVRVQDFVTLRRAGWLVSPILEGRAELGGVRLRIIGIDPLTAPLGVMPQTEGPADLNIQAFLLPPYQVITHPATAKGLKNRITNDQMPQGVGMTDIAHAQRLLDQPGYSALILHPNQPAGIAPLEQVAPHLTRADNATANDISRLTDSFHLNLTAFGFLSFAVGLFIVHSTIGLAFEQRRAMFRTMRALGLPLARLIGLLIAELVVIALIAGAIGMVLGFVIAALLLPDVAATLRGLYGAEIDGALSLRPSWWLAGGAMTFGGTGLAAMGALLRVAQMPLLAAAQHRAWAIMSERQLWRFGAAAGGLALVAVLALQIGSGLTGGFILLGAMLIAAAFTLPIALFAMLRLGQALARGPVAQWFWADTRQQLSGLSLSLMALLLALATNIGVSTMVQSFRLTFTGWLDQRLASELYVTAQTEAQSPELRAFLTARADAVLPIWFAQTRLRGLPADVYGTVDHPTYRENWPLISALPDVWDQVTQGRAVLINEQMSLRDGLRPGDRLMLTPDLDLPIAGVYSDYGNPIGQAIIGLDLLERSFADVSTRRYGVRIAPDRVPELTAALRDFGLSDDNIVNQAAIKAFSLRVFDRTFTVTGALNVLTLAVAGFAIFTSLLTLAALRQPQLAPVWALGLTRRHLAALELARAVVLGALTLAAALPLGVALAWVLLNIINVEAFGWRLPMHLIPADWLRLGALALLATALSAAWPALRLSWLRPSDLLRHFAHER